MSRDLRPRVMAVLRRHGMLCAKFRRMPAGVPDQLLREGFTVKYPAADVADRVHVDYVGSTMGESAARLAGASTRLSASGLRVTLGMGDLIVRADQ